MLPYQQPTMYLARLFLLLLLAAGSCALAAQLQLVFQSTAGEAGEEPLEEPQQQQPPPPRRATLSLKHIYHHDAHYLDHRRPTAAAPANKGGLMAPFVTVSRATPADLLPNHRIVTFARADLFDREEASSPSPSPSSSSASSPPLQSDGGAKQAATKRYSLQGQWSKRPASDAASPFSTAKRRSTAAAAAAAAAYAADTKFMTNTSRPPTSDTATATNHLVPDPNDRETVLSLAQMANQAYYPPNATTTTATTLLWLPVDGYQMNTTFGLNSDGLRGYVWASEDDQLLVIAFKGTSASFLGVGGEPSTANDKLHVSSREWVVCFFIQPTILPTSSSCRTI